MRVEIIQEMDPGDPTLEIPWTDPENPECCYVNLRANPSAVEGLLECRGRPSLCAFLLQVNSAKSPLYSAKCGVWETDELSAVELPFGLPCKVGSYVDILFAEAGEFARLESNRRLANRLATQLSPVRLAAELEMCIRRCLLHPEEFRGYYLTLFTHAYGEAPEAAEREWSLAIEAQAKALMEMGRETD